jgi:CheY-like chemotaxis protein
MANEIRSRILIVDDDARVVNLIAAQLEGQSSYIFEILTAANGIEGLALNEKTHSHIGHVDVIISDYDMPKMNGLEMLCGIREKGYETPFVLLTGLAEKEKAMSALRLGALDVIEKPHTIKQLMRTMNNAVKFSGLLRELDRELRTNHSKFLKKSGS